MPSHMTWDEVGKDFTVTLEIAPESGSTISGHLVITTAAMPEIVKKLSYADLVPSWSHTMGADQALHMTLMLAFHTDDISTIHIVAKCRNPEGETHQVDYSEQFSGKRGDITHAYVWVN